MDEKVIAFFHPSYFNLHTLGFKVAGITLVQAEAKLAAYLTAETAVLAGQDMTIDGTRFTRADLAAVQKGIERWEGRVARLSRTGLRVREVIPR